MRPDPYLGPCELCPMPDTCDREGDCRARWDSRAGARRNAAHRALAERHPCPYCDQPAGQTCTNPTTGEPLGHQPAHAARIAAIPPREATP